MRYKIKTQSMLEYLIVLTAVVIVLAIVSGNGGLLRGGIQRAYDDTEKDFRQSLDQTMDDTHKESVIAYTPESLNITVRDPNSYGGRPYFEDKQLDGYYYHEGQSDMSAVPAEGTVIDANVVTPEVITE